MNSTERHRIASNGDQPTRDTPSAVMAAISFVLAAAIAGLLFTMGTWWSIVLGVLVALLLPVFGYGFAESLQPALRDNEGKRVER